MPAPTLHMKPQRQHRIGRIGWLRAAVLGANDGIVSTASLLLGVATAHATHRNMLIAGVAGLAAGSMAMAAGEYVSVHSQADTELAELELERIHLASDDAAEHRELENIYIARGLEPALATQVAAQLMARNALDAHAHDELGISSQSRARPIQAAIASAASFAAGAALPLLVAAFVPREHSVAILFGTSLLFLALLGAVAARVGGASAVRGMMRVAIWGALAMAVTAGIGALVGVSI